MNAGRRRRGIRIGALVLGLALTAAACGGGGGGSDDDASASAGEDGGSGQGAAADLPSDEFELAREVTLADGTVLAEGDTATVADLLDGRPVVVNFFASWCAPCRAEMPDLQDVFQDIKGEVNMVGLTNNDSVDDAAELIDLTGVQYPWGHDGSRQYVDFGLFGMPATVYISPEGEILQADNGIVSKDQIRDRVTELFGVET